MNKPKGIGAMVTAGNPPPPRYKASPAVSDAPPTSRPAPSEKGGGPSAPSDLDANRPEQDVTISPEAVGYHDSSSTCSSCEYLAGDQCRVLKMPVDPQGHCQAYEGKAGDMDMPPDQSMDPQGGQQFGGAQ